MNLDTLKNSEQLLPVMDQHPAKNPERLTWQLAFVVFSAAFGAWFPIGYMYSVTNPIQAIVLKWIRSVQCSRLSPALDSIFPLENGSSQFPAGSPEDLWCSEVTTEQEKRMLELNPQLNTIWAVTGCVIAVGAFISLWTTNFWLDRFGSKRTLLYNNWIAVLGSLLSGLCVVANSWEMFIVGRLVLGFNVGIAVSVVPLFCAEISPPNLRGAMGTVPGVCLVTGSLVAIVLGLPQLLGTTHHWPIISLLRLVPCIVLFLTIPFCPESPRYLLIHQKDKIAASKALIWLRGTEDIQAELKNLQLESETQSNSVLGILDLFRDPFLRKVLGIALVCIFTMQLSGIGPVTIYTTDIFIKAKLTPMTSLYGTIGVFVLQILAVFLSMLLMDRAGRRVLLLVGFVGSAGCCFLILTFSLLASHGQDWAVWANLTCVLAFILVFNLGPAFVPWILVGELFPTPARGSAMTLVSAGCHFTLFACTFLFPVLQLLIGDWTFAIFGGCVVLGTVFLYFHLIETKGKDFEQIQTELRRKLI